MPVRKRKAEDDGAAAQSSSKKTSASHGKKSKSQQSPAGPSEEALFKIRHAAEFDGESIQGEPDGRIQVKQEPDDDCLTTVSPRRTTRSSARLAKDTPCDTKLTPTACDTGQVSKPTATRDDANQETVFVAILSQASCKWDLRMTESAIENLSRRARQRAANGQLFDVAYVRSIIDRLDRAGIEDARRSHVVTLLQTRLRHSLGYWSSCINFVGVRMQMPLTLPDSRTVTSPRSEQNASTIPNSSKMLYVDVSPPHPETPASARSSHASFACSESASDSARESTDSGSESEYVEHKRTGPAKAKYQVVQASTENQTPSTAIDYDKTKTNVQLYGTRFPKAAFDVLVRCIIFAWAAAPHPGDTPANIREYARPRWRKVPWEQKCAWQKLHEERGDPAVDELHKGLQLVLSQDLLKAFVPGDRLPAALARCQQHTSQVAPNFQFGQSGKHDMPLKVLSPQQTNKRCSTIENSSDAKSLTRSGPSSSEYDSRSLQYLRLCKD